MTRLQSVTPDTATGKTKEIFDGLTQKQGKVVNIFQGMGNSAAALEAYLAMAGALAKGELATEDREAIYLAVSESNGCQYCVAAHTAISNNAGISEEVTKAARQFRAADEKRQTLLNFIRQVIDKRGFVADDEVQAVRDAGYTDGQIAESVAYIGLATYSNLFNHVYDTPLDFPAAPSLED